MTFSVISRIAATIGNCPSNTDYANACQKPQSNRRLPQTPEKKGTLLTIDEEKNKKLQDARRREYYEFLSKVELDFIGK